MLDGREQEFLKGKLSGFNIKNITNFFSKKKERKRKKKKKNVINILLLRLESFSFFLSYLNCVSPVRFV